jgi:two-component system sensor histidine kinase GlrK
MQVFEAFYQGHTVAEGHIKGSGLGLAIAREYALAHQGQLDIVEEPAEPGGCIRLSLPLLQEPT